MGQICFINKDRPADQKGMINLPGGKVEETDENPAMTALREFKEETGIELAQVRFCGHYEGDTWIMSCFSSHTMQTILKPREGETEIPFLATFDEVKNLSNLMPNLRGLIPLMQNIESAWWIRSCELENSELFKKV